MFKTLKHAPEWSPEICRLLNLESDNDWRVLAQYLGYKTDDIRNWATQPNPCMSLLDEQFATHHPQAATKHIHNALEKMKHTDAQAVVAKALDAIGMCL